KVDVCSQCHPFYTGSKRIMVEQGGRIDKFKKRYGI
ncbi:MAG: 50S ribosomal protein L31, partial [Firmicutes bacterium]|nr:50S ribosomal protein L31 [Bacillota bacterium]